MSFRFIHTADVHLDSPLVGLSAYGDEAADVVRQASRVALVALVDLALDREVDFMVVAGDLFDGSWPDAGTGHFFTQQMVRLQRQDIPAYVLRGNHDAQSKFTKSLNWPDNVHTFKSNKPHTFAVKGLDVALHGQSFATPAVTDNIAIDYPAAVPGHYNIGVLHTALEGNAQHAPYAPCTLGQLQAFGYDYWALGHVHEYSCLSTAPHVVYPGNLQGRNIRETGPKGAVLVDVAENATTLEQVFVDTVRWHRVQVAVDAANTLDDVFARVRDALKMAHAGGTDGLNVMRVQLQGATGAHNALQRRRSTLRDDIVNEAIKVGDDNILIEKVLVETQPASATLDPQALEGALGDLIRHIHQCQSDDEFKVELMKELNAALDGIDPATESLSEEVKLLRDGDMAAIIETVALELLARVQGDAS